MSASSGANDELIRLILSVEGKEQLAELRASEAGVRDEMETLRLQYEVGSISQEKFLEGGKRLSKSAAELGATIARVTAAEKPAAVGSYDLADSYELVAHAEDKIVVHAGPLQASQRETAAVLAAITAQAQAQSAGLAQLEGSMKQAGHASGRQGSFGQGMLQAGYLIDDVQYGVKGIVNNIPGLILSLGLGTGVAGVLGIVAVGVSQIVTHWDSIKSLWESDATRKEAARMKELAAATELAKDKLVELQKAKGKDVDEAAAGVDLAVHDVGYKQAVADAKRALIRDAAAKGQPIVGDAEATARAERLLSRSAAGNAPAQKFLADLFDEQGPDGGTKLGKALADPGGKKAGAAAEARQKSENERQAGIKKKQAEQDEQLRTVAEQVREAKVKENDELGALYDNALKDGKKADDDQHKDDPAKIRGNTNRLVAEKRRREALPFAKEFQKQTGASNDDAIIFGKTAAHAAEDLRVNGGIDGRRSTAAAKEIAKTALGYQGDTLGVVNANGREIDVLRKELAKIRRDLETSKARLKGTQPDAGGSWSPFG
jgi:hypothetical protein